jgi:methionyl-tRNA formyltransferase
MKVLFLTNNKNAYSLAEWICEQGDDVLVWEKELTRNLFFDGNLLSGIEFIISYNYIHIITGDVIQLFPMRIINLHISLLPWNRGASPNLWSFVDDTPKGVTIHLIDKGLDTGDILLQQEIPILVSDRDETLEYFYAKLHTVIQVLFKSNWDKIKLCEIIPLKQNGSYHIKAETDEFLKVTNIKWSDKIVDIIHRTEQNRTEQNRTEQNRTEQNRTEQNRTEQNRTEQNVITILFFFIKCFRVNTNERV